MKDLLKVGFHSFLAILSMLVLSSCQKSSETFTSTELPFLNGAIVLDRSELKADPDVKHGTLSLNVIKLLVKQPTDSFLAKAKTFFSGRQGWVQANPQGVAEVFVFGLGHDKTLTVSIYTVTNPEVISNRTIDLTSESFVMISNRVRAP